MSSSRRRVLIETLLSLGALAGVTCIVAAVAGMVFGLSPLVFRSGSMEPAIATGDLAVARTVEATDLHAGDVVSVQRPDGTRVTHRVVSVDARVGNSATMTLRGDANPVADPEPYTVTEAQRVLFHVPRLGYVVTWFVSPFAWVLATLATVGLLWAAFRPDRLLRPAPYGRHARRTRTGNRRCVALATQLGVAASVIATAVTGFQRTEGTFAALSDSATATGTVSAASPPEAPASLSCANVLENGLATARLSWPNPVAHQAYQYQLVFRHTVNGSTATGVLAAGTANPYLFSFTWAYANGTLGLTSEGLYNIELRSKVGTALSTTKLSITASVFRLSGSVCGALTGTASTATTSTGSAAAARAAAPATTSPTTPTTTSSATTSAPATTSTTTTTPTSTTAPTTSSSSVAPSTTSASSSAAPTTGTRSPDGAHIATIDAGEVTIRDTATDAVRYRAALAATDLRWSDASTLLVTRADGSVTTVTRAADGTWSADSGTPTVASAG